MLSGITSLTDVTVASGNNVYGTSFAIDDSQLLVNLDFNQRTIDSVNYFVEAFEADYNAEYAYDNAYYFVQKLKPGLRESYEARLNKFTSPPTLLTVKINNGATSTKDNVVTIATTYDGQAPTHIMISEDSTFTGANWVDYAASVQFTLSEAFGQKTIYTKLKNVYGESSVLTASIEYQEPELVLTSLAVLGGATSTSERDIQLNFAYTGFPTDYMLSENSDFSGATWLDWTSNPSFELSAAYGIKTIYGKLKNAKGETGVKSTSIELIDNVTVRLNSIALNDGDDYTNSGILAVAINITNIATKYKVGLQSDLSDCPDWLTYTVSPITFDTKKTSGEVTVYVQVANESSTSDIKSDTITIVEDVQVTDMILANGATKHEGLSCPVAFTMSSGTPTHYRLSETLSDLSSADWIAWTTSITYLFSTLGNKSLYGQVKNQVSESTIVSDSIELVEAPVKIVIGFNGTANQTVQTVVANGDTINQIKTVAYNGWSNRALYDTSGAESALICHFNNNDYPIVDGLFPKEGMDGFSSGAMISVADDSGVYPVSVFLQGTSPSNGNAAESNRKFRFGITFPAGTYKVKLLCSPPEAFKGIFPEQYKFGIYDDTTLLTSQSCAPGFTGVGNNQYNIELDFTIDTDKLLYITSWYDYISSTAFDGYRMSMNLIEISSM
jgi:hypothetical protein